MSDARLAYGLHAVRAALEVPGRVEALWLLAGRDDERLATVMELAARQGLPVRRLSRQELDALAGTSRHQGVVARLAPATVSGEHALEALVASLPGPALLLVLDGVQDPHNLGACLRTANAAGAHAVIAPRDRAAGLTPAVRKVAAGAAEATPFFQVTNLARTLRFLKDAGIWLVGTAGEAETSLYAVDLTVPVALVMGAEGEGMRRLTREHCDYLVHLPMAGTVESLNVAVAAGICLYEAVRQRQAAARRG
ncbi:MAG TPA: 23S rRNA (guanosine(2251)-2'-O)-methyltransferase RlmB [Gammaproteobacteria bacterium]|nr:23S rRNA (guanosine(2251)-2'-O)-methyltransferase RlmB [Gammaproteobacteria bacterium]